MIFLIYIIFGSLTDENPECGMLRKRMKNLEIQLNETEEIDIQANETDCKANEKLVLKSKELETHLGKRIKSEYYVYDKNKKVSQPDESLKWDLFTRTKDLLKGKIANRDYILPTESQLRHLNVLEINKDCLKLKVYKNMEVVMSGQLDIQKYIDKDKCVKPKLINDILNFFKNDSEVLEILTAYNLPKIGKFLKESDKLSSAYKIIFYKQKICLKDYANFDNFIMSFNAHENVYFLFQPCLDLVAITLSTKYEDYNLEPLIRNVLSNMKNLNQLNLLVDHQNQDKIFDFLKRNPGFYLSMLFYPFLEFKIHNVTKCHSNKIIFEKNYNPFLKDLSITLSGSKVKINQDVYESDFITLFVEIYSKKLYFEFEVAFYLFNSIRLTKMFDIVMTRLLKHEPENLLVTYMLNTMGFLNDTEKMNILECIKNKKPIKHNLIIEEIRSEINNFIYEDIYKGFVLLFYLKFDKLLKEPDFNDKGLYDLTEEFKLLKDDALYTFILNSAELATEASFKDMKDRRYEINQLFNSRLFYFIKHILRRKTDLNLISQNLYYKIYNLGLYSIGAIRSYEDNFESFIQSFSQEDTPENQAKFNVEDIVRDIFNLLNN